MSIGETTTRFCSSSPRSLNGMNIGGRGAGGVRSPACRATSPANQSSTCSTNSSSRRRRLSYVIRRLRVSRLKMNCSSDWWTYCSRSSNHWRLAAAARCVLSTSGRRAASYTASAVGDLLVLDERLDERRRVLDGELRRRADREMGGVRRIAEQRDVAVVPALDPEVREADPLRVVREQLPPFQHLREQLADDLDAPPVALARVRRRALEPAEACAAPDVLVHLDDERRLVLVVRVRVHLHDPVRRVDDEELEGVVRALRRSQMNLHRPSSIVGRNVDSYFARTADCTPSAPTIRS